MADKLEEKILELIKKLDEEKRLGDKRAKQLYLHTEGWVNVKSYGAKGDDSTDDTDAIQAAIDSVSSGGKIFFPKGTYLFNAAFDIPSGLSLEGVGSEDTALKYTGTGSYAVKLGGYVSLHKLKIRQTVDRSSERAGILTNLSCNKLRDVAVYGFKYGIKLEGDNSGCSYNDFYSVRFWDNYYDYYLTAKDNGWCNENHFYGGKVAGCADADSYGVYIDFYDTHELNGNQFFGVAIETSKCGAYCDGIQNGFYGCRFENVSTDIHFGSNSEYNTVFSGQPITIIDDSTMKRQILIMRNKTDLYSVDTYLLGRYYDYRFSCNLVSPYPLETYVRGVKAETIDMAGNKWIKGKLTIKNSITQTTGAAAPTTGTWAKGDICWNTAPAASGKIGWVCVAAGTPGTWKAFGVIDA